ELVLENSFETVIKAAENQKLRTLELQDYIEQYGARDLILWLELEMDGQITADNFVSFARPKHMQLEEPEIKTELRRLEAGRYWLSLKAEKTALWTWLELKDRDLKLNNNFFHLYPGREIKLIAEIDQDLSPEEFEEKLIIRSLIDTY
ncbi:MAG: glycoside hydrolase family 2 protein, partial [Halanaerobium sp.]